MKGVSTIVLIIVNSCLFSQSIESITEKISSKICECLKEDVKSYSEIKLEFNRCYDKEFNTIFSIVNSEEQKILVERDALAKIKSEIIPTLNTNCKKIQSIIQSEMNNSVESATNSNKNSCPTNFNGKDIKKIKKRMVK
jgi:hypothetical protein